MSWFWIGLSSFGLFAPMILFEIGKCHTRRELRKNILELQKIKENSNAEISALIEIHFEELSKLDRSLKDFIYK
jgi:broad-specificity NMP kinase